VIGLDTNVLVRFLVRDDDAQHQAAVDLLARGVAAGEQFFIAEVVLAETSWVLASRYRCSREELAAVIRQLVGAEELTFESADRVVRALHAFEQGAAGFADYLIGEHARDAGCREVYTFDQKLLRDAPYVRP
jgi:predicted nucleic-acid-binding protein